MLPENKPDQDGEYDIFQERCFGSDRNTITKTPAVSGLTCNKSIPGKESEE